MIKNIIALLVVMMLTYAMGSSFSFAQNNTNDTGKKTKGDEKEKKEKPKPKVNEEFDQTGFNIGVDAAVNGTFVVHQQTYGLSRLMQYSPSVKFGAELRAAYNFDETEGIVVGFGYAGAGQNYHDYLDGISYSKSVTLNYLQVPVMFKYIFNTDNTQPYAMAGVQMGSLQSSSVVVNGVKYYPNDLPYKQGATSSTHFFQSTDLGFRLELGDDFMITDNLFVNAGIEGYIGLPDINNPDLRHPFTFHGNAYTYKKSSNIITGIVVGIHYMIN